MLQDTLPVLNIIIRRFKMNYRELKRAKFLLDGLENVNRLLKDIVEYNFVEIRSDHFREYFEDENKKEIIDILESLRDKKIKELKELGVTEV